MKFHLDHLPAVQAAIAAARACRTVDDLAEAVHSFKSHPAAARDPMPSRAGSRCTAPNPVMILGKTPAATEAATRVPFSGPAGQVLRRALDLVGLDLEACRISCASPWPAKDNTPNATQLAFSRPFLFREIELVRPSVIICLGQKADEALTQRCQPLGDRVGTQWTLEVGDHSAVVALTWCHGFVSYGEKERMPDFTRQIRSAMEAHPQAFASAVAVPTDMAA